MQARSISGGLIILLGALVAGAHALALHYSLYWRFRWFDMPMHFLGGFLVVSAVLWCVTFIPLPWALSKLNRPALALASALIIGIAWEVFEYTAGITRGEPGYWFDTLHDLALDLFGGGVSYLAFKAYGR
jgi:hypothetical protein